MSAWCIYCGNRKETTRDHTPPVCFFPKPRPSNLITVPCCTECNREYGKIDERIRNLLTSLATTENHPAIQEQIADNRDRSYLRAKGSSNFWHIRESITMADVYSPGGIYLGSAPAFNLDQDIMDRFMERMTRALLYWECSIGYIKGEIKWRKATKEIFESMPPGMKACLTSIKPKRIGNDIFTYVGVGHYRSGATASLWSVSFMSFYGSPQFMSLFRAH